VINFVNFSFALFTPPLGDFQFVFPLSPGLDLSSNANPGL
jgi:hypothetical protein